MTVWTGLSFVSRGALWAALLCVITCDVSKLTTDSPTPAVEESQQGDFIHLASAPDVVEAKPRVQVKYKCSQACKVGVEIVLSTPKITGLMTFRRTWSPKQFGETSTRTIQLAFPPAVVYKRDFFIRRPVDAQDVMVRTWLVHLDGEHSANSHVGISQYHQSLVRTFKFLQTVPLTERPVQPQRRSVVWGAELMWNLTKDRIERCSRESDVVDLLAFPFASTEEKHGVIRTFRPFMNRELESRRLHAKERPRVTLSVWLYLLDWCSQSVCGVLRHVNEHRKYGSPLIMLTASGKVVVQVSLVSREEMAFTAHTPLPLSTWIRLDLFLHDSQAKLIITDTHATGGLAEATHTFQFQDAVLYNDTSGYFVIGGDVYMPGILGYYGPIKYHRLGAEEVVNPLSPERTLKLLDEAHVECDEMRQITEGFIHALHDHTRTSNDTCDSYYEELRRAFVQPRCTQTWSWDHQVKYSTVLKILSMQKEELISGPRSSRRVFLISHQLFQDVVRRLGEAGGSDDGPDVVSSVKGLLKVCSCWGHHQASLMLATLHLAGLGLPVDQEQGHVYSLMAGLGDERLSLLHLGYKHMHGLDGFPEDQDMAYGYYANVGHQTSIDHRNVQDLEQSITEHVHLTRVEELRMQTGEEGDVVQFLRMQAERGDTQSQKTLAQMLFWGSNGVTKDISEAVKWFASSGLQRTDPTTMYDYGILLLKGTGVKKNRTLGLKLLKEAADMGSVAALNGLGWYYNTVEKDDRKAVYYFELAARNGSRDGVFNLGVYHLKGANPETPEKNETAAFECFLKAGELGHMEGAVEAASSLSRGILQGVPRDPVKAVILLKHISERNGYLGSTIREALQTYQQGSWGEALVKYAMLAETGVVVAQNNAAHLCELLNHGSGCHWRYHNYSTHNHIPHESGLLKMGDHYSSVGDMVEAISLYSRAALHGSPQGVYNLAVLTEEGYKVSGSVLDILQVPVEVQQDRSAVVERLLLRCREFEGEKNDVSPCALALFRLQLRTAWRKFTHGTFQQSLAWGTIALLLMFVLGIGIQNALARHSTPHVDNPANQSSGRPRESDSVNQVSWGGVLDAAGPGGPSRPSPLQQNGRVSMVVNGRPLQEAADLVITATGVCVCALCTMFVYHLF